MLSSMNEDTRLPRSPELMSRGDTALLVIDVQEKLLPAIADGPRVVWNVRRLIDAAKTLGLPVVATEQYPKGLGPTVAELAQRLGPLPSKLTFSAGGCPQIFADLRGRGLCKILVCGIEAHVCVAADGLRPAGRRLAGLRRGSRGRVAFRDRPPHGAGANGLGRNDANDHRGGDVRVVRCRRHARVQGN